MNHETFDAAAVAVHHNPAALPHAAFPAALQQVLSPAECAAAQTVIGAWAGYAPSPLLSLDGLAAEIGVAEVLYKDESSRFGLGSFKALGGAYAVLRLLASEIGRQTGRAVSDADIETGRYVGIAGRIVVVTATDGNHGRSVAWGARRFGCKCIVYMHAGVSKGRARAIQALGATVVWVTGSYDDSVARARQEAAKHGWYVVADTSYEGYTDIPRHVMAGYTLMMAEVEKQLPAERPPSHVFVQGGVGGLAAAVCAHLWQTLGAARPRFIVVEPDRADCLFQSAKNGTPTAVDIVEETVMAGLSCGEVSALAWRILAPGADDFMRIADDLVAPVMRLLASGVNGDRPAVAGESAVAGLAALIAAQRRPDMARALALDTSSRVLVIGTEGATDPDVYQALVGRAPEDVIA